jgi:hypothetical protein
MFHKLEWNSGLTEATQISGSMLYCISNDECDKKKYPLIAVLKDYPKNVIVVELETLKPTPTGTVLRSEFARKMKDSSRVKQTNLESEEGLEIFVKGYKGCMLK